MDSTAHQTVLKQDESLIAVDYSAHLKRYAAGDPERPRRALKGGDKITFEFGQLFNFFPVSGERSQ
jgi:hypothetical protein